MNRSLAGFKPQRVEIFVGQRLLSNTPAFSHLPSARFYSNFVIQYLSKIERQKKRELKIPSSLMIFTSYYILPFSHSPLHFSRHQPTAIYSHTGTPTTAKRKHHILPICYHFERSFLFRKAILVKQQPSWRW